MVLSNIFKIAVLSFALLIFDCHADSSDYDVSFVGDINLGRLVRKEIDATSLSPWSGILKGMPSSGIKIGNFEGVVGESDSSCLRRTELCFNFKPEHLRFLKEAGFTNLSLANNHSMDEGNNGMILSRSELLKLGISGSGLKESPILVSKNGVRYGLVFINQIKDASGAIDEIPSARVAQAISLAKTEADWVVVYIHWGSELITWANQKQYDEARWLVAIGADMIVGSHPHVIQQAECINGSPVWFSLGNHIFDQKYEDTHQGGLIACNGSPFLKCNGFKTKTQPSSSFINSIQTEPELDTPVSCVKKIRPRTELSVNDYNLSISDTHDDGKGSNEDIFFSNGKVTFGLHDVPLRRVGKYRMPDGMESLFLLVNVYSDLDKKIAVRPHFYKVGNNGILPLWRGSGLAFPLIDALPIADGNHDYLCALHSGGSFLLGEDTSKPPFTMIYQWNGFGFSALKNKVKADQCMKLFSQYTAVSMSVIGKLE